jgi:hypothetical protein
MHAGITSFQPWGKCELRKLLDTAYNDSLLKLI